MIFFGLHQAWIEEIASRSKQKEAEGSRNKLEQFRYYSEIFARIVKFSLCIAISLNSEFSLC